MEVDRYMIKDTRGWHGDPEGHARAAEASHEKKTNWWPLFVLPLLAFIVGMGADRAIKDNSNNANSGQYQQQQGVGGSGYTPCPTPGTGY